MRYQIFLLCFLLPCFTSLAQGDKLETVTITLPGSDLHTVQFPFDVPFYIISNPGTQFDKLTFRYRIKEPDVRSKKWISFPDPDKVPLDEDDFYTTTVPVEKQGGKVTILCPGMHPNIIYEFEFVLSRKITSDEVASSRLKEDVAAKLKVFFESRAGTTISVTAFHKLEKEIDDIVFSKFIKSPDDLLLNATTRRQYHTDLSGSFATSASNIQLATQSIFNSGGTIDGQKDRLFVKFDKIKDELKDELEELFSANAALNNLTKEFLASTFNPSLPDFKNYTVKDGLLLLKKLTLDPSFYQALMDGTLKITNNDFIGDNKINLTTHQFLQSLFRKMNEHNIVYTVNGQTKTPFLQIEINELADGHRFIASELVSMIENQAILDNAQKLIPDITAKLVLEQSFKQQVASMADVVTNKTPYISVDAGLGYTGNFETGFFCYGANLYLAPVNKKASGSSFKGFNRFKKSFFFQIGIAQYYGDRPANTRSMLGNSSKYDLMLGIGYRVLRVIKLNAGILPYKTNNSKPLTDDHELKVNGFLSISWDIDLLGALGRVGELLKF